MVVIVSGDVKAIHSIGCFTKSNVRAIIVEYIDCITNGTVHDHSLRISNQS